jgi:lia operon protein LiaF
MRNRGQLVLGVVIILVGVLFLVGNLLDVDTWGIFWPSLLILLGVLLFLRPRWEWGGRVGQARYRILGDIRRNGVWQVGDEELWVGIGEVELDMINAEIPPGETHLHVWGFVGDVELFVPQDVGVSLSASAFVVDARVFGRKRDGILVPVNVKSDNYETAERKVRLETTHFVGEVKVKQV